LTVDENGSLGGFGEDDDLKAILGQFAALLAQPAPGRSADRRVAGQSSVCSVAVSPLRRVPESMRRLRRVGIFVIFAVFAVSVVGVFAVNSLR
jgi:hypothetical protein